MLGKMGTIKGENVKSIIKAFLKASRFVFLLLFVMFIFFLCAYSIFFMTENWHLTGSIIAFIFWGLFIGTFIAWEPDKKEALKKENKNV